VGPGEPENPQQVADGFAVGVAPACIHATKLAAGRRN
jgi:hypothetical protein